MNKRLTDSYLYHRQRGMTARAAFEAARQDGTPRYPNMGKPYDGNWQPLEHTARSRSRAYYSPEWPFKHIGRTDEVGREHGTRDRSLLNTRGFYTDDDCTGTLEGHVLKLPGQRGFVPATRHTEWDGVTVYPLDRSDDPLEAAHAAYGYAERDADKERDYQRAWQAGSNAGYCNEEAIRLRREIIQTCADLRHTRHMGIGATDTVERLCEILRSAIRSKLADLYRARRERDQLKDEYGSSSAFAEGYGS